MEVFGAVGTAITLIQMTKNSLGRARRVGQGIEGLRIILVELREIQDDVDPVRDRDLLAQIAQLVEEARELIEDNSTPTRLALKFLWTNSLDADVQRINTSLAAVCRRLERRARNQAKTVNQYPDSSAPTVHGSPELEPLPQFPPTHQIPRKRIGSTDSYDWPRERLRPVDSHRRRPSSTPSYLPTTLVLHDTDNDPIREPIPLEKLCVLDRDDFSRFRTIQYESADQTIVVTHEIRYGTIPSTFDELAAKQVSFLENQLLTLETETEFAIYLLSPLYDFQTPGACNEFMARIRERTLVASFLTKEICKSRLPETPGFMCVMFRGGSRDTILARCKLVRLWSRTTVLGSTPLVTMTFHDRSKHPPKFTEWSLKDFRETALLLHRGKSVELSRYDRDEQFVFTFERLDDATAFRDVFERNRKNVSISNSSGHQ